MRSFCTIGSCGLGASGLGVPSRVVTRRGYLRPAGVEWCLVTPPASPTTRGRLLIGAAIVLLALNLRVAVGSLGVVLGSVRDDLGMSTAVAGVVTTVPVVCFAVFGVGAHGVVKGLGLHRTAALVLSLITVGLVLR